MLFDLVGTDAPEAVLGVADEAVVGVVVSGLDGGRKRGRRRAKAWVYRSSKGGEEGSRGAGGKTRFIPSYQMLRQPADLDIVGKVERLLPADNLPVDVLPVLGTERRPANEALEHDGAERPLANFTASAFAYLLEIILVKWKGGDGIPSRNQTNDLAPGESQARYNPACRQPNRP